MKTLLLLLLLLAGILVILVRLGILPMPDRTAEKLPRRPRNEQVEKAEKKPGEERSKGTGPASAPAREQDAVLDMMGELQ